MWNSDFSFYEGFEPYPYSYNFKNSIPDYSFLTGSYDYNTDSEGNIIYSKNYGSKWEIMDKIFPLSFFNSENAYYSAFDSLGLSDDEPYVFNSGNCFGMAFSSVAQYSYSGIVEDNFPEFSNNVGTGFIWDNIEVESNGNNWIGLDENIKTILAYQLFQKNLSYSNLINNSINNNSPTDILNQLINNSDKNYILHFRGKDYCILGLYCTSVGHAVIPYKVEGNKIYIMDNNYPYYPLGEGLNYAYERYIEIDLENNTYNVPGYDWDEFEGIGIVDIDDIYGSSSSLMGFNDTDVLYSVKGDVDILLIDGKGRKTGYENGSIYEEIPGANIVTLYSGLNKVKNKTNQIYLPKKIDNINIEIKSKLKGKYDLMIAGGNYYTKLSNIETSSGQIDKFNSTRENLKIDFDDNKEGSFDLKINDFKSKSNLIFDKKELKIEKELQKYIIDWDGIKQKNDKSIKYQLDTNLDGNFDKETFLNK